MDNIIRLPITHSMKSLNKKGKNAVPCIVTDRWLKFPESSDWNGPEEILWVDVMTWTPEGNSKKLTTLAIEKSRLSEVLRSIKTPVKK